MRITSAIAPKGADGKSAYQVWLDAGNVGTQAQYIASLKGAKGDTGNTGGTSTVPGPQGAQGVAGSNGANGTAATITVGTVTGLAAGVSPTITNAGTSSAAVFNFGIPTGATGAAGSNAAATPLGSAMPLAPGTASAGSSASAARDDHRHPLQAGTLTLMGAATVGETLLVSLSLGVKRYTGTISGLAVGDRIMAFLTGAPGASSLQDIYVSATNTYNVGVLNPALGIGATVSVPIAVYRLT